MNIRKIKKTGLVTLLTAGVSLPLISNADTNITISGVAEIEASAVEKEGSDITLATIALAVDAKINEKTRVTLVALHEDDDTEEFVIDEGFINIDIGNGLTVTAGRMYIPFGNFETNMVSDPLTLEIAETQESAIKIEFEKNAISGSLYVFNGDAEETNNTQDKIDDFGINLEYTIVNLNFGLGYINNISETDTFQEPTTVTISEQDAGLAFHAIYSTEQFDVIVERISALDELDNGTEPAAANIEVGYHLGETTIALGYQNTDELGGVLPEEKTLLSYTTTISADTVFALEYSNSQDYSVADGGLDTSINALTAKLAIEF